MSKKLSNITDLSINEQKVVSGGGVGAGIGATFGATRGAYDSYAGNIGVRGSAVRILGGAAIGAIGGGLGGFYKTGTLVGASLSSPE